MLKSILLFLLLAIIALTVIGVVFVNFAPQFGAVHDQNYRNSLVGSKQFNGQRFINQIDTNPAGSDSGSMLKAMYKFITGVPNQQPDRDIEVLKVKPESLTQSEGKEPQLVWFGHSSFLLKAAEQTLFFDPVFSEKASPHPWLGSKRYNSEFPMTPEQLPEIDAVVISHDHYDHLDYNSVLQLDHKVKAYYVPLGVASHLISWGIAEEKIKQFDWWQSQMLSDLEITFTPARHFSGRRITNQNHTLWGGWYVKSADHSLFFSGDTGYGPHFNEIKLRLGAPDFALLECGQYNEAWSDIHMLPEQTVQAAKDLEAKVMMPIHWGAFTLSIHTWTEPVERALAEAEKQGQNIVTPAIGERMLLKQEPRQHQAWWLNY